MRPGRQSWSWVMSLATLTVLLQPPEPEPVFCDKKRNQLRCEGYGKGVELSESQVRGAGQGAAPEDPARPGVSLWYTFRAMPDCPPNDVNYPTQWVDCETSLTECLTRDPPTSGPYSRLFRRVTGPEGAIGGWGQFGLTCFPDALPERTELTEEMLIEQFHSTEFAPPVLSAQPPDGQALVNLPVFFAVEWGEGFGPDDIDSANLIGREVRIRPALVGVTYHFGDGTSLGPTTSLGGTWPDGDVTKTYLDGGTVAPYSEVTYGGDVSVDGDDWVRLPVTIDITGPELDIAVRTSTNRLVPDSDG